MTCKDIEKDLNKLANKEKTRVMMRFFKTGPGQYGEGDVFIGLTVPEQRIIAKKYKEVSLVEIQKLLKSKVHEHRLTALLILTYKYPEASEDEKKKIYDAYLANTKYVNNWDLVDVTTPQIVGAYLLKNKKEVNVIYKMARSKDLWERRIAMLATFPFIRARDFKHTLAIATILLQDEHDLIHKAVGWLLREIGKLDQEVEEKFLRKHYKNMPRTMLRYAIERFEETKRKKYLNSQI